MPARMSGRSEKTIRRWIASGRLSAQKVAGAYAVDPSDLAQRVGDMSTPGVDTGGDTMSSRPRTCAWTSCGPRRWRPTPARCWSRWSPRWPSWRGRSATRPRRSGGCGPRTPRSAPPGERAASRRPRAGPDRGAGPVPRAVPLAPAAPPEPACAGAVAAARGDPGRGRAVWLVAGVRWLRGDGMLTLALAIAITYLITIVVARLVGLRDRRGGRAAGWPW